MRKHNSLWFIAILPPEDIREEVKQFKEYAKKHFDSGHALRSPAHITLFPPFRFDIDQLPLLEELLTRFTNTQSEFFVDLNGFNCFSPRVIFVDVKNSLDLQNIQNALMEQMVQELSVIYPGKHGFHPHMTVAFKDLHKTRFQEAWDYFAPLLYQRSFRAKQLSLLKHNGSFWQIHGNFPLKTKVTS